MCWGGGRGSSCGYDDPDGEEVEEAVISATLELLQGDAVTIVNADAGDDIGGWSNAYHTRFEGHLINRT